MAFYAIMKIVFPPAPRKGMVSSQEKGTFSALERPKRALLSVQPQVMRALLSMSLILHFISSISRIVLF